MAKEFIDRLLVVEAEKRMTSEEALQHQWIKSFAASSSFKNLHGSISSNWLKSSSRLNSANSNQSKRSNRSSRSEKSVLSRHRKTIPSQTTIIQRHAHVDKKAKSSKEASRTTRNSNVKLTKQLVEKLQSVAQEADAELPLLVEKQPSSKTESTPVGQQHQDVQQTQCQLPGSSQMEFKDHTEKNFVLQTIDEPMPDAEEIKVSTTFPPLSQMSSYRRNVIQNSFQFAEIRSSRLSNFSEVDEDMLNRGDSSTMFPAFHPQRQTNNFIDSPVVPRPFAMDIDYPNEVNHGSLNSMPATNLSVPTRFRTIMSPNSKRNKVSCSFSDSNT